VMQQTMGLTNLESLLLTIVFVFGYIFVGGTYAHAYTNTLQGIVMLFVSAIILASGIPLLRGGFGEKLAAADPRLLEVVRPDSPLFSSVFSIFVCGFVIGFALVCQPHIMTKALYVKSDRDVWKYLGVNFAVSFLFTGLLLVGLYARLVEFPPALLDPVTGLVRQDGVVAAYLAVTFPPAILAFVTVAILAAGMSTLDGILVALSTIVANDLVVPASSKWTSRWSEERRSLFAHRASRLLLIAIGVAAFFLALDPPQLLGIFGQFGVYGVVAAATVPIIFGIVFPRFSAKPAATAAVTALTVHFGLSWLGRWAVASSVDLESAVSGPLRLIADTSAPQLGLLNPAVTATYAILASVAIGLGAVALDSLRSRADTSRRSAVAPY
jgi:sodium/pantothenate symporter